MPGKPQNANEAVHVALSVVIAYWREAKGDGEKALFIFFS
jgi:hypothetical protein